MADLAAITAKLEALQQRLDTCSVEAGTNFDRLQVLNIMSQHAQREEHMRLIKRDLEDLARHRREQLQVIKDGVAEVARALLAEGRR